MTTRKDPLWSVVKVLPTDYAGYGGEVPEAEKTDDCSCGCRWAAYLEESGDWLVCTKPGAPRFGLLTFEHQGGKGCFEWGCMDCLKGADECTCPEQDGTADAPTRCSFCGKGRREIDKLIVANAPPARAPSAICNECLTLRPEQYAALVAWADDCSIPNEEAAAAVAEELRDRVAPKEPATTWGWSTSPDPEYWYLYKDGDGFPTREAAIAGARADADFDWADELWVLEGRRFSASSSLAFDIQQAMCDFVIDNYGAECAEGWPDISPPAAAVLEELLEQWANHWVAPLPWRATGKPKRVEQPRLHVMDAPDGPRCRCGKPSTHASGWCGSCSNSLLPCRPKLCGLCGGVNTAGCEMCGGTGRTCTTHARSWSLCTDEGDKWP